MIHSKNYLKREISEFSSLCFQMTVPRRRFEVLAEGIRYSFLWMHVSQIAMNKEATEMRVELTQASIEIQGVELEALYQAFHLEVADWVQALPEGTAISETIPGPFVKTIQLETKNFSKFS